VEEEAFYSRKLGAAGDPFVLSLRFDVLGPGYLSGDIHVLFGLVVIKKVKGLEIMVESLLTASTYPIKFRGMGNSEEFEHWLLDTVLWQYVNLVWEVPKDLIHKPCAGRGCVPCKYHGLMAKLWYPCYCQSCCRPFVVLANHIMADTRRYVQTSGGAVLVMYQCPKHQSKKHKRWAKVNDQKFAGYLD
jgi:hypothetical protein